MDTRSFIPILLLVIVVSCNDQKELTDQAIATTYTKKDDNLLASMSSDELKGFQWMNIPQSFKFEDGSLLINPGDTTDFFNDPASEAVVGTAPMFYIKMKGDFIATAKVKPNFRDIWNACALMVYQDSLHWGKFCFENSDATGVSIVSVVTKDRSDDSNGPVINEASEVWMKVARKGKMFGFYWSLDGFNYKMARLFSLPVSEGVKIGMVAQCPAGNNVEHEFSYFSIEEKTIKDMRKGF